MPSTSSSGLCSPSADTHEEAGLDGPKRGSKKKIPPLSATSRLQREPPAGNKADDFANYLYTGIDPKPGAGAGAGAGAGGPQRTMKRPHVKATNLPKLVAQTNQAREEAFSHTISHAHKVAKSGGKATSGPRKSTKVAYSGGVTKKKAKRGSSMSKR